ncbi:MAG TPA: hypothetical protein VFX70_10705 [Mycobacteriales bacterium]|nr:hypothetical protein [Mycobacteriales bacterium]
MTGALLTLPSVDPKVDPGQPTLSSDMPGSPDPGTVDTFAEVNSHLWRLFALARSKSHILPLARNQIGALSTELRRSHGPTVRQHLCALMGDLLQLTGEIFFDGDRYTDAAHCYTLAATAGREAGAFDLWSCAMVRHAFVEIYERRFGKAVPMLELATALARRGDPMLSTRHWVAGVQAEAFAGLGNVAACERALEGAERVRGLAGSVHNGGWLRFGASRLAEDRGRCYVMLGRFNEAESVLAEVLPGVRTERRRASVLTDLAAIGVYRRDPEQVVARASDALAIARRSGSGVVSRTVGGLRPHLAPLLADPRIQRLDDQIAALRVEGPGR